MKQKMRGLKSVGENDFEKLVGDLDESISGSDSDDSASSDDDGKKDTTLSALLKKQANIADPDFDDFTTTKTKVGAGKPPLLWFSSSKLPSNVALGVLSNSPPRRHTSRRCRDNPSDHQGQATLSEASTNATHISSDRRLRRCPSPSLSPARHVCHRPPLLLVYDWRRSLCRHGCFSDTQDDQEGWCRGPRCHGTCTQDIPSLHNSSQAGWFSVRQ